MFVFAFIIWLLPSVIGAVLQLIFCLSFRSKLRSSAIIFALIFSFVLICRFLYIGQSLSSLNLLLYSAIYPILIIFFRKSPNLFSESRFLGFIKSILLVLIVFAYIEYFLAIVGLHSLNRSISQIFNLFSQGADITRFGHYVLFLPRAESYFFANSSLFGVYSFLFYLLVRHFSALSGLSVHLLILTIISGSFTAYTLVIVFLLIRFSRKFIKYSLYLLRHLFISPKLIFYSLISVLSCLAVVLFIFHYFSAGNHSYGFRFNPRNFEYLYNYKTFQLSTFLMNPADPVHSTLGQDFSLPFYLFWLGSTLFVIFYALPLFFLPFSSYLYYALPLLTILYYSVLSDPLLIANIAFLISRLPPRTGTRSFSFSSSC